MVTLYLKMHTFCIETQYFNYNLIRPIIRVSELSHYTHIASLNWTDICIISYKLSTKTYA